MKDKIEPFNFDKLNEDIQKTFGKDKREEPIEDWPEKFRVFWYQAPVKPIQDEVTLIVNWMNWKVIAPLKQEIAGYKANQVEAKESDAVAFGIWLNGKDYQSTPHPDKMRSVHRDEGKPVKISELYKEFKNKP